MPVPFETLIPYGIIIAMFGVTGAGVANVKYYANDKKRARRSVDQWDRQSMTLETMNEHAKGSTFIEKDADGIMH